MGTPTTPPLVERRHDGGFLISEGNGHISRETRTLTGAARVLAGTVLGQQTIGTGAIVAPVGANIGNGTFGPITLGAGVMVGVYKVDFYTPLAYIVAAPGGQEVGRSVVGSPFSAGGLSFTITAGATAFSADDSFTVTVPAGTGKVAPLNLLAYDGTQIAHSILYGTKNVTTADSPALVIARMAEVNGTELIWPAGISPAQITTAHIQLASNVIFAR